MEVLPPRPQHTPCILLLMFLMWIGLNLSLKETAHQKSFQSTNQLLIFMSLILTFSRVHVLLSHTSPRAVSAVRLHSPYSPQTNSLVSILLSHNCPSFPNQLLYLPHKRRQL